MSPRPPADSASRPNQVAIVGNDAVLAALPFRTMQLAHALHACGFDSVVPVSWGEELVAREVLQRVAARDASPAIFCACPLQRARLLAAGSELAPFLLSLASPTVATARYLRALHGATPLRITAIGGCPGDDDPAIDARIAALELHALLDAHDVLLSEQPEIFESVIPPDRRRHFSLPGGCPTPRMLELHAPERRLVTITDAAFADELADVLLGGESVLVDLSPRLACTCCGGFVSGTGIGLGGRDQILRSEPPRAPSSSLEHGVIVDLSPDIPPPPGEHVGGARGDDVPPTTAPSPRPPDDMAPPPLAAPSATGRVEEGTTPHLEAGAATVAPSVPPSVQTSVPMSGSSSGGRGAIERPRIAVTPAGAMRGASTRRRSPPPQPTPSAASAVNDAPRWTVRPAHDPGATPSIGTTARVGAADAPPPGAGMASAPSAHDEEVPLAGNVALPPPAASRTVDRAVAQGGEGGAEVAEGGEEHRPAHVDDEGERSSREGNEAEGEPAERLRHAEVAVPLESSREGMPVDQEPAVVAGEAWPPPPPEERLGAQLTGTEVTTGELRGVELGGAEIESSQLVAGDLGDQSAAGRAARTRASSHRFLRVRVQSLPRATSGGRRVPRAYARHLSAPARGNRPWPRGRADDANQLDDAGAGPSHVDESDEAFAPRTDVELRLEVSVEPPVTSIVFVAADPEDEDSTDDGGGVAIDLVPDGGSVEPGTSALEAGVADAADAGEGTDATQTSGSHSSVPSVSSPVETLLTTEDTEDTEGGNRPRGVDTAGEVGGVGVSDPVDLADATHVGDVVERGDAGARRDVAGDETDPVSSAASGEGAAAAGSPAVTGAISEDVLARVRQRARAKGRTISRENPAPRPSREPGSLVVFIASVILVVALLVALAVIFRRAPTAPW